MAHFAATTAALGIVLLPILLRRRTHPHPHTGGRAMSSHKRHWLHSAPDVAAAVAQDAPDLTGWEFESARHDEGAHTTFLTYVDDDGAVATFGLRVVDVDLDERRVKPEPHEGRGR